MSARRRIAKALFAIGGRLSRIKVWSRMYKLADTESLRFERSGRAWITNPVSLWLLDVSERVDPQHWEHWALDHSGECTGTLSCGVCGGTVCAYAECGVAE